MKPAAAAYNGHTCWEGYLAHKDVWQSLFQPTAGATYPLFVNTAIEAPARGIFDVNWAGYPDVYALLGFLQYVFLPTAFYSMLHPQAGQLYTPVLPTAELLDWIAESDAPQKDAMRAFLSELDAMWELDRIALTHALGTFSERLSDAFSATHTALYVRIFRSTYEVAQSIKDAVWAEDVFKEDFRITSGELDDWCRRFYHEPFARHSFLKFLNERVGLLA